MLPNQLNKPHLLFEKLTDKDIKVGDAYKTTHVGNMIDFV